MVRAVLRSLGWATVGAAALSAGSVTVSRPAWAQDKKVCFSEHADGQEARRLKKLRDAKAHFIKCAGEVCPGVVRAECAQWLAEVRAALPTVVVVAKDANGQEAANVKVTADGEVLTERLDGSAIELDPGERALTFELEDGKKLEETYILYEGDQRRKISVDFSGGRKARGGEGQGPTPLPGDPERDRGGAISPLAYVVGGVGIAGLGGFAYFALSGKSKENDLTSNCAPNCSDEDVDSMRRRYLFADISLGVGVVSLGVATWMILTHSGPGASKPAAWIDVQPTPGGFQVVGVASHF